MNTFSYFAECKIDSTVLISAIRSTMMDVDTEQWFSCKVVAGDEKYVLGCAKEIQTDMSYEQVINTAYGVPDSHVLRQTLRQVPLSENSLERDFSVQ